MAAFFECQVFCTFNKTSRFTFFVAPRISDKRRILETSAVLLTALGKFVFMDYLEWRLPFILCTLAAWSVYIYNRRRTNPSILAYWGFRNDNLKSVLRRLLPFALLAVVSCAIIGAVQNTLNLTWHILPILIVYPIWGTIQQFLCVGLVAGNSQDISRPVSNNINILTTALLFGAMHYPNGWLMAGTFALALLYSAIYLRERNLFALGLFHGWLGALFYYTVVGRDPYMEVFEPLFKQ